MGLRRTRSLTTSARTLTGASAMQCTTDPILTPVLVCMTRRAASAVRSGKASLPVMCGFATFANISRRPPLSAAATATCRTKRMLVLLDVNNALIKKRIGPMRRRTTHGRTGVPVPSRALMAPSHRGGVQAMVDVHR